MSVISMSWMTDSKWSIRRMRHRYEDVCCLIHSMDGEIFFLYRGKINKKNEIKLHVSWWQWWLKDVEESHLTEQLTEREWRRPLTWLDRFRDAVLLPASWGDESIQPHVGNRRWNILYLNQASTRDPRWTFTFRKSRPFSFMREGVKGLN